jgi:hypothetical protein
MSFKEKLTSLMALEEHIRGLSRQLSQARKEASRLKQDIAATIRAKNETGVRLDEHAFVLEDKTKLVSVKAKEKTEILQEMLRSNGVRDTDQFVRSFTERSRVPKETTQLKIRRAS